MAQKDPAARRAYMAEYRKKNPHKISEWSKKYYQKYRERELAKGQNRYRKDWANTRTIAWKKHLKKNYNITPQEYDQLFNIQNGECAICGTHQMYLDKTLNVDHNHETGKIRGLLCLHCNSTIGYAKENVGTLALIIDYLNRHNGKKEN